MPIAGLAIIFNVGIYEVQVPSRVIFFTYIIFALFTILLPLALLPLFSYMKLIGSIELTKRSERTLPLTITATSLILLHILLARSIPIRIINSYSLAIAVLSIALLFLNIIYKVSMHTMAIGGIIGLLAAITLEYNLYPFYLFALAILVSGIIASARIHQKAHNLFQTSSGFVIGAATTYFLITYLI